MLASPLRLNKPMHSINGAPINSRPVVRHLNDAASYRQNLAGFFFHGIRAMPDSVSDLQVQYNSGLEGKCFATQDEVKSKRIYGWL